MPKMVYATFSFKHVRRIRIEKNPYNYGIMRSRFIRIYMLRMNQSLECIIPYHSLHPLSEKFKFPRKKLHSNAYFYVCINECYYIPLRINIVPIERIDTLWKISKGWLYNLDMIHFFVGGEGNILIHHAFREVTSAHACK